jgi:hypothetical protein
MLSKVLFPKVARYSKYPAPFDIHPPWSVCEGEECGYGETVCVCMIPEIICYPPYVSYFKNNPSPPRASRCVDACSKGTSQTRRRTHIIRCLFKLEVHSDTLFCVCTEWYVWSSSCKLQSTPLGWAQQQLYSIKKMLAWIFLYHHLCIYIGFVADKQSLCPDSTSSISLHTHCSRILPLQCVYLPSNRLRHDILPKSIAVLYSSSAPQPLPSSVYLSGACGRIRT